MWNPHLFGYLVFFFFLGNSLTQKPIETIVHNDAIVKEEKREEGASAFLSKSDDVNTESGSPIILPTKPLLTILADANNNSEKTVELVSTAIRCGSDRVSPLPQSKEYREMDNVESSNSQYNESYFDSRADNYQSMTGHNVCGEDNLQHSSNYSDKLAAALALSSQESGQLLEDDDGQDNLPDLIPWLPVNISRTATAPKCSVSGSQSTTAGIDALRLTNSSSGKNLSKHTYNDHDQLVDPVEIRRISSPQVLLFENTFVNEISLSGSASLEKVSKYCSNIATDKEFPLRPSVEILVPKTESEDKSVAVEMLVPKIKIEEESIAFSSSSKLIPDTSKNTAERQNASSKACLSLCEPRHFLDALTQSTSQNSEVNSEKKFSYGTEEYMFTPDLTPEHEDHFFVPGSPLIPTSGSIGKSGSFAEILNTMREPVYGPVCAEEEITTSLPEVNTSLSGNTIIPCWSSVKLEPVTDGKEDFSTYFSGELS